MAGGETPWWSLAPYLPSAVPPSLPPSLPSISVSWDEMSEILPEDLLILILSYLPARDIIFHCRLVSQYWKYLADQPSLWTRKYKRDYWISAHSLIHPLLDMRKMYVLNPFNRNLLPTLDIEGDESWYTDGGGIIVESRASEGKWFRLYQTSTHSRLFEMLVVF